MTVGRITHSMPYYYTIGVSALKADQSGDRYREEAGIDMWLHPLKNVEAVGRSSYNAITDGWMEHDHMRKTWRLEQGPMRSAGRSQSGS